MNHVFQLFRTSERHLIFKGMLATQMPPASTRDYLATFPCTPSNRSALRSPWYPLAASRWSILCLLLSQVTPTLHAFPCRRAPRRSPAPVRCPTTFLRAEVPPAEDQKTHLNPMKNPCPPRLHHLPHKSHERTALTYLTRKASKKSASKHALRQLHRCASPLRKPPRNRQLPLILTISTHYLTHPQLSKTVRRERSTTAAQRSVTPYTPEQRAVCLPHQRLPQLAIPLSITQRQQSECLANRAVKRGQRP